MRSFTIWKQILTFSERIQNLIFFGIIFAGLGLCDRRNSPQVTVRLREYCSRSYGKFCQGSLFEYFQCIKRNNFFFGMADNTVVFFPKDFSHFLTEQYHADLCSHSALKRPHLKNLLVDTRKQKTNLHDQKRRPCKNVRIDTFILIFLICHFCFVPHIVLKRKFQI